jgi:uncharacterized protein (DUF4415 family)
MTVKSTSMRRSSKKLGSDLKRVDAHVIAPHEYDELPEITDADVARGVMSKSLKELPERKPRGRPHKANPKVHQGLRLSADVLAAFRSTGPGWQSRIDDALRQWLLKTSSGEQTSKRRNKDKAA